MSEIDLSKSRAALRGVPIEMRICVGRATPTLAELLELDRDAVLPLDTGIDDAVEIMIGDRVVAVGELIENEDGQAGQLAVRLTEVVDLGDAD
ncbi:MAG: FliM/FliN family flagellar motor C-terminal domain-containing protein [Pseudomonadota bacterium]